MKKNPYQFTIRFNSTIAGHCQAAAFLNRCGTRAKAHVIAEALDLYLREKKQLLGLGELERIEVVPKMNGQEQREDKRQEKKADQKAIPKPEPVVYAPEVEALNEEDLDAIAASLGAWDMED